MSYSRTQKFQGGYPDRQSRSQLNTNFGVSRSFRRAGSSRHRGGGTLELHEFNPPEKYYGDERLPAPYKIVIQPPGEGYSHVVTERDVRDRIDALPLSFKLRVLEELNVVQLSGVTKKKSLSLLYGMQWGKSVYLYAIDSPYEDGTHVETFSIKPKQAVVLSVKRYGARISGPDHEGDWSITWPPGALKNYYLNDTLTHELSHLIDDRNKSFRDREAYAEHTAIKYGNPSVEGRRQPTRRHHKNYLS